MSVKIAGAVLEVFWDFFGFLLSAVLAASVIQQGCCCLSVLLGLFFFLSVFGVTVIAGPLYLLFLLPPHLV